MVQKQQVVLECDDCGRDGTEVEGIETYRVVAGIGTATAQGVEAELCPSCWVTVAEALAVFLTKGRPMPMRTKLRGVKDVPGTTWRFTSHALIRCGQRDLDPLQIVRMLDNPAVTRPGKASDQEIRERAGLKAVVVPDRGIVVTVARHDEDAVDAYVEERVG